MIKQDKLVEIMRSMGIYERDVNIVTKLYLLDLNRGSQSGACILSPLLKSFDGSKFNSTFINNIWYTDDNVVIITKKVLWTILKTKTMIFLKNEEPINISLKVDDKNIEQV